MAALPNTRALYGDCVASLRSALGFLESSVATLDAGVQDLPRMQGVLKTIRHYELIAQPTLAAAEASLQTEIGPAVATLLDRAAHQLARQARRIDTLQARAALQAGRLEGGGDENEASAGAAAAPAATASSTSDRRTTAGSAASLSLRARMTHQRREQLKYSVARLERELAQKERELRQRLRQSTVMQ